MDNLLSKKAMSVLKEMNALIALNHNTHEHLKDYDDIQSIVTDLDLTLSKRYEELLKLIEFVPVVTEENISNYKSLPQSYWLVDPLDGSANFSSGINIWASSFSLYKEGSCILSAVVTSDSHYFVAQKNKGVTKNNNKLEFKEKDGLKDLVLIESHASTDINSLIQRHISSIGFSVRNLGSSIFSGINLLEGRIGGVVYLNLAKWDVAPVLMMAKELNIPKVDLVLPDDHSHTDYTYSFVIGKQSVVNKLKDIKFG